MSYLIVECDDIKNIFDQFQKDIDAGHLRDASYVYGPSMPRMVYFGIKVIK